MNDDTLFSAILQIDLKDIESISIEGYVKAMIGMGQIKNRREAIQYVERNILDRLIDIEAYEKCAWLKGKLDKVKAKLK